MAVHGIFSTNLMAVNACGQVASYVRRLRGPHVS
jgi:hypothetical protein